MRNGPKFFQLIKAEPIESIKNKWNQLHLEYQKWFKIVSQIETNDAKRLTHLLNKYKQAFDVLRLVDFTKMNEEASEIAKLLQKIEPDIQKVREDARKYLARRPEGDLGYLLYATKAYELRTDKEMWNFIRESCKENLIRACEGYFGAAIIIAKSSRLCHETLMTDADVEKILQSHLHNPNLPDLEKLFAKQGKVATHQAKSHALAPGCK